MFRLFVSPRSADACPFIYCFWLPRYGRFAHCHIFCWFSPTYCIPPEICFRYSEVVGFSRGSHARWIYFSISAQVCAVAGYTIFAHFWCICAFRFLILRNVYGRRGKYICSLPAVICFADICISRFLALSFPTPYLHSPILFFLHFSPTVWCGWYWFRFFGAMYVFWSCVFLGYRRCRPNGMPHLAFCFLDLYQRSDPTRPYRWRRSYTFPAHSHHVMFHVFHFSNVDFPIIRLQIFGRYSKTARCVSSPHRTNSNDSRHDMIGYRVDISYVRQRHQQWGRVPRALHFFLSGEMRILPNIVFGIVQNFP